MLRPCLPGLNPRLTIRSGYRHRPGFPFLPCGVNMPHRGGIPSVGRQTSR
ncbi:MAG: hypothetical protein LBC94_05610 [Desulfovibrio sp.]|nr:hypothetical protein [Desulfovibrio sp.]